ncbi:hypothetical protein KR032_000608 [Drosophila birchii]|nr:hypothetical protein KR032_000608 [Drosophila birchii]
MNLRLGDNDKNPERAQATYRYYIPNVARLTNLVESPQLMIRSMQWRIRVIPNSVGLGVFVHCSGIQEFPNWSCNATVEFRILSYRTGVGSYVKGPIKHIFNAKEDDYGYGTFVSWQKLLLMVDAYAPYKGILLEVQISAKPPQGMNN